MSPRPRKRSNRGSRPIVNLVVDYDLWMLLSYYAYKYHRPRPDVVRAMIRSFLRHDTDFDPEDFAEWVETRPAHWTPASSDEDLKKRLKEGAREAVKHMTDSQKIKRGRRKGSDS